MKIWSLYWWSRNRLKKEDGWIVDCTRNAILFKLMDISGITAWDLVKKIQNDEL